jgi:hypothetical protein
MQSMADFAVLMTWGSLSAALYASTLPVAPWRKSLRPTPPTLAVRPT